MSKILISFEASNPDDLRNVIAAYLSGSASGAIVPFGAAADEDDNAPADPNAPTADSTGLPWDARIHSANRKLSKDGKWRSRRGVADNFVASVEAELRAGRAQPFTPPGAPPVQPAFNPGAPPSFAPPNGNGAAPPVTPPPMHLPPNTAAPGIPPGPGQLTASAPVYDFNGFVNKLTQLAGTPHPEGGNYITDEWVQYIAQVLQLTTISDLQSQPHLINKAISELRRHNHWLD